MHSHVLCGFLGLCSKYALRILWIQTKIFKFLSHSFNISVSPSEKFLHSVKYKSSISYSQWLKRKAKLTFGEANVLNMWSVKSW